MPAATQEDGQPIYAATLNDHAQRIDDLTEGRFSRYYKDALQDDAPTTKYNATAGFILVQFPNGQTVSDGVIATGDGNSVFELTKSGVWRVRTRIRITTTAAASSTVPVEGLVALTNGAGTYRYDAGQVNLHRTDTSERTLMPEAKVQRRFDAGDTLSVRAQCIGQSSTTSAWYLGTFLEQVAIELCWLRG